ncbi:MAG: hypothetical protein UY72_C0044G0011 [Candidatus Uhrbacteria bacterium GW2011_GWD2_52_7]|uniref:Uncharacterized protein n=1 Tax=Candidatus Uhrbacteria bacterium GW2011_GWD2_52_7 TaxID=1618989 RepID=A0A0G2AAP6_9BACT|nr:MAG: hypothetical protein UY72_C0044G0011 [Candidatus Uhrbacteria bacterium GW2011_GWD2_52_7]
MQCRFFCPECRENFNRELTDEEIQSGFAFSEKEMCPDCKEELSDTYFITKKKAKQFLIADAALRGERWLKDNGFWNNPEDLFEDARSHAWIIVGGDWLVP